MNEIGSWASVRRGGVTSCCVSPGLDKENVELSPTAGHCNSGRTRHGSASQVQKQRSAGSFKRNSIKKIVWSVLCFTLQTNLTWLLTSDPSPCTAALRVLWSHLVAVSPDGHLLEHCLSLMLLFFDVFPSTLACVWLSTCSEDSRESRRSGGLTESVDRGCGWTLQCCRCRKPRAVRGGRPSVFPSCRVKGSS